MKKIFLKCSVSFIILVLAPFHVSSGDDLQENQNFFIGTYKSEGSCVLFNGGAVVQISEVDSMLTRYEELRFAPGVVIQTYWYPAKGYGDDVIRHERRYGLPMINVGGWYKTTFSLDNEKMRYQVTEKRDSNSALKVRQIVELVKTSESSIVMKSFYGMSSPSAAENQKQTCRLVPISVEEFDRTKKENGPYTTGDRQ